MSTDKLAFIRADMDALAESNLLITLRAAAEWETAKARFAQALLGEVKV